MRRNDPKRFRVLLLRLGPLLVLAGLWAGGPAQAGPDPTLPQASALNGSGIPWMGRSAASGNGLHVAIPNGYATITVEDLSLQTTAGPVRWRREWDGQEWRFNPHWESLSQSWKNLTGSQTADGTPPANGVAATSSRGDGCWVWVDEDWEPGSATSVVGGTGGSGGEPATMAAERLTPFNRIMGDNPADYAAPMRVSLDYATLCAGSVSGGGMVDAEAIRRQNELYLGEGGRYSFSNQTVLEKRAVRALPAVTEEDLASGRITLAPVDNPKGYRWLHRGGDWIDYNTQGQVVAYGDHNDNTVWLARDGGGRLLGVADGAGRVLLSLHYSGALLMELRDYPIAGHPLDLPARSVHYEYDAYNRLIRVTDLRGNVTGYGYDPQNRITRITDPENHSEQLAYQGYTVSRHTAADGAVTDYSFDYDDTHQQFVSKITGP